MTPRVVGLDLSMTATGIAYEDGSTRTVKMTAAGDERLAQIVAEVALAIGPRGTVPNLVVIEDAPPGLKGPAIKAVHMVHGAVRAELIARGRRYVAVNPTVLKRFATGKSAATKADMALALYKRAGLELGDDNQVDAWWLRAVGLELLGASLIPLPAAQVAALDKLAQAVTR